MRHYDGPVVLLEEDHYVAEDFLHALWLQHSAVTGRDASAAAACPYCAGAHVLSLGSYPKVCYTKPRSGRRPYQRLRRLCKRKWIRSPFS